MLLVNCIGKTFLIGLGNEMRTQMKIGRYIATFISDLKYQSMKSLDLNYFYGYYLFLESDNTSEKIVELDTLFRICSQACECVQNLFLGQIKARIQQFNILKYDVKYFHDLKWPLDKIRFENLLIGFFSKPFGNYIVLPNLCFLSQRPQILATCANFQ